MNANWLTAVERASTVDLDLVPAGVLTHVGHVLADTVGVAVAGARAPEVVALVAAERADGTVWTVGAPAPAGPDGSAGPDGVGGGAGATVLVPGGGRARPELAAFLNATAGTFLELDEGMRPTGHPGMHVVPAALAVAEAAGASGPDLLRAVLAGYEVTARLFTAFRLRYPVHPHGHFGAVGAAVAVAMLRGSDPVAVARVAATTPLLPIWNACYEGATARNTYTGTAAQAGVRAERLARAGFTGSTEALAEAFGTVAGELVAPDALTAPLDHERPGITRNYFKRHSACALSHAALDAVGEAVRGGQLPPAGRIERIEVHTVANNLKIARAARPNDLSARFSLPHAVAAALLTGRTDPAAMAYRPEVARLAERVEVSTAEDLQARWPEASPARVVIRWPGGEVVHQVDNPRGHHASPLTGAELAAKFRTLVGPGADGLWHRLTRLPEVDDVRGLFDGVPAAGPAERAEPVGQAVPAESAGSPR